MRTTELTELQLRAARMIAMGISFNEIATELNINRTTIYRWRQFHQFATEVSRLANTAREKCRERVIQDISEIKDIVMNTLIDVALNDSSGSARVSAARALTEMIQKAEDRSDQTDVMRDQSEEIKRLLQLIQGEQLNINYSKANIS